MASEEEEKLNFRETDSAISWAVVRLTQLSSAAGSLSQIQQISPASLAYLGDAVYELFVRTCYLLPPQRLRDYHRQVVAQVRAETQAETLQSLKPYLSDHELEILRRGRNAATGSPRRLAPEIYQIGRAAVRGRGWISVVAV
ncbi:MAG: hypothetical protein F6K41_38735, partial [Symploca sp. SIO3E6]|nr:hypothetical protein [Caldora sp. SIO3E6]